MPANGNFTTEIGNLAAENEVCQGKKRNSSCLRSSHYETPANHWRDLAMHWDYKRRARHLVSRSRFVDASLASQPVFLLCGVSGVLAAPRQALGNIAFVHSSFTGAVDRAC